MSLEIIPCIQGTSEWYSARLGIPTSSEFKTIIGVNKDARDKATRRTYMMKLAAEIISGELMESYENDDMRRGKIMEAEARSWYGIITDAPLTQVGFIRNGNKGASPDSLVGTDGLLEIKTAKPHLMVDYLLKDDFPPEHKAQCQGGLWVAEREWLDIVIYWPSMPKLKKRIHRDEQYILMLSDAVDAFNAELAELVARVKAKAI